MITVGLEGDRVHQKTLLRGIVVSVVAFTAVAVVTVLA